MSLRDNDDEYVPTFLKTEMPFVSNPSDAINISASPNTLGPYPSLSKPLRSDQTAASYHQWLQQNDGSQPGSANKYRTPPKPSYLDATTPSSSVSTDSGQYYSANTSFEQPVHISEPVGESWPFPVRDRTLINSHIQRSPRAFSDPVHRGTMPVPEGTRNSSLDTLQMHSPSNNMNSPIFSSRKTSEYSMNGTLRSVSWNALNPSEWSSDRVLAWLDANKFGDDWISIFRSQNVHGSEFLALANYQNLKKLGIQSRLENDTRPSRFIHLLRKLLDRSQGSVSTDPLQELNDVSQHKQQPSDTPAVGVNGIKPPVDQTRPTIVRNTHDSSENLSTLRHAHTTFIPRTRANRPVSTFESSHLVKPLWQSPSSPSLRSGVLLRRHRRSSSSESAQSSFGAPLEQTVSLDSVEPNFVEPNNAKPPGVDLPGRRGLFNKFKSRSGQTKSKDNLKLFATKFSMPSPAQTYSFLPEHLLPSPAKIHKEKLLLITFDNENFKLIDFSAAQTIQDFKALLADKFSLDLSKLTLCLTEFAHEYGSPLDDKSLTDLLYLQGKDSPLTKFFVSDGLSRRSSLASEKSASRPSYPNTPAHLIGDKRTPGNSTPNDYFNIKNAESVKLESPTKLPAERELEDSYQEQISSSASFSTFRVIRRQFSGNNDSFTVLRPSKSPVEADVNQETKQPTNLVALREAPPPPLPLRQSSVKLVPTKSLKKAIAPPRLTIEPVQSKKIIDEQVKTESGNVVKAYSPGQSQQLIPQPYKSRKQKVARKPVSATATTAAPLPLIGVPNSPGTSPSIQFQENDISWEDAPEFVDNNDSDDDSDSGLWAKKPPSSTTSSNNNTLRSSDAVEIIHGSSHAAKPNLKVDTNTLTPVSPSRISSVNSPSPSDEIWAVRPPAEVVYDNLERFFPDADLDKPIIDETNVGEQQLPVISSTEIHHQTLSPVVEPKGFNPELSKGGTLVSSKPRDTKQSVLPKRGTAHRMKSIRVVAREASEARRKMASQNSSSDSTKGLIRRKSTKLWGQKIVEMTRKDIESGHVSKLRDQKGGYQQYLWVKGELIGKGTFGKVYLGLNATAGEMMAVKQVEIPDTLNDQDSQRQKEVIEALHSEVETLKDLDHLNIVQYLGFESFQGVHSLFLEYVPGGSIGKILRMHGRFEEPLIRSLTRQVLEGLSYLHSKGILHRDLKADNLLLDLDGICKISDFGISKKSRNIYTNDAEFSMQGTIFWMAPEVIHNVVSNEKQGYSAKVDVWSLGCVVLEMFAGRRPWSTDEAIGAMFKLGTTKQAPPIPEDTQPFVSDTGRTFLDLCFIINPEQRPTAQTLLKNAFSIIDKEFDFSETSVARKIRFDNRRRNRSPRIRQP